MEGFEEIDFAEFDNIEIDIEADFETRYIKPPKTIEISEHNLKYKDAAKLASDIEIKKGDRYFCIVNGSFIFGDFIEAYITSKNIKVKKMFISTLSMSMNNIDSLANLLNWGYVKNLDLIISDFFFSHERQMLIKSIYEKLDKEDKFQLSVAGSHTKICMFETECGQKIVIHGSANLRSSSNIEQFVIEESETLYDFNFEYMSKIVEVYKTINKPIRVGKLWELIK